MPFLLNITENMKCLLTYFKPVDMNVLPIPLNVQKKTYKMQYT